MQGFTQEIEERGLKSSPQTMGLTDSLKKFFDNFFFN